ncbi:FtsX-like permease family protein [Actinopolymorpha sp. B11F2]|uniref:FtsX-like permease family protein n=1 Tax=Actinopolymorpha sp. B11F2 TaxID=3160862 RepID=UPI0032E46B5A
MPWAYPVCILSRYGDPPRSTCRPLRSRRGCPIAGVLVAAGAAVVVLVGGRQRSGGEWPVTAGTLALVAGAIMLTPTVMGAVGRIGGHLPLSMRMATRDAARHRGRTVPAVAAIMGAVAGVTALAIGSSSDYAESRREYVPLAPVGTMTVDLDRWSTQDPRAAADAIIDEIRHQFPGRTPVVQKEVPAWDWGNVRQSRTGVVMVRNCTNANPLECAYFLAGGEGMTGSAAQFEGLLVADPDEVAAFTTRPLTAEQRAVLDRGGVLVPDREPIGDAGTVRVVTGVAKDGDDMTTLSDPQEHRVPAGVLPGTVDATTYTYLATAVMTPQTAEKLGLQPTIGSVVTPPGGPAIDREQEARFAEYARGLAPDASVYVERGFVETFTVQFLVLALVGGLIVVVGTATATALALDDARPDLATLAAVGASPGTRRRTAMGQASVIGLLGALFGLAVGIVPGVAVSYPLTAAVGGHVLDIPWTLLGLVAVGVPLLAVAGAGIFTRSRLPMVQRVD